MAPSQLLAGAQRLIGVAMALSPHPDVVCTNVSGGGILLHTGDEVYYGLDPVGLRIWELLRLETRNLDQICEALAVEYPEVPRETLHADVAELLNGLTESGLLIAKAA